MNIEQWTAWLKETLQKRPTGPIGNLCYEDQIRNLAKAIHKKIEEMKG